MSRNDIRAEDVLTVLAALATFIFLGAKSMTLMRLDESNYWDFAFILLPVALLLLRSSIRYAFRPMGSPAIAEVTAETGSILRDWSPFLVFLMLYETFRLNSWNRVLPVDKDLLLLRWDEKLFGVTPSVPLDAWTGPRFTQLMTIAYVMHLILPPIMALAWYRRSLRTFREFLMAVLVAGIIGSQGYLLVPAIGPGTAFPNLYKHTLTGSVYQNIIGMLDAARAPRDAFPSLHVAISSIVLWYAWRRGRLAFAIILPIVLANWLSTVYLRYHYMVDVIAGWAVAIGSIALASLILRFEKQILAAVALRSKEPLQPSQR